MRQRTIPETVRLLGGTSKTFLGWPLAWFEPCDYSQADGLVNRDGTLSLAGHSGYHIAIRMKADKRKRAGWNI